MRFFIALFLCFGLSFGIGSDILSVAPMPNSNIESLQSGSDKPVIYKDMIKYFSENGDSKQLSAIGVLVATGTNEPDSIGDTIIPNPQEGERLLLKSANMGNNEAYAFLGALYLINETMRATDPDLKKSQKYLELAYKNNVIASGVMLANVYLESNQEIKGIQLLLNLSNKADSSAELALALMYLKGFHAKENGEQLIEKNITTAEYYLTRACTNKMQAENVKNFCNNPSLARKVEEK